MDLSEGAFYLLIIRRGLAIEMESLSLGEYLLLNLLGQGHTITEAYEQCLTVEPEFELAENLRRHIAVKTLLTQTALVTRKTDRVSVIRTITAGLDWLSPLADLAVRLWVTTVFFKSGLVKIQSWDSTLAFFTYEYSVPFLPPELAAYLGAFTELFFPVLLTLGLASRFSAAVLFGFNIVAVISYPALNAVGIEQHQIWGLMLLVTLLHGPGKLSVDHVLGKRFFND